MKKVLFSIALFAPMLVFGQLSDAGKPIQYLQQENDMRGALLPQYVIISDYNICSGTEITAEFFSTPVELQASSAAGNSNEGVMFDITAAENAIINGFTVNLLTGPANFQIYYKTGSHVGFENSTAGWTLLGSSTGIAAGVNVNTGIALNQPIIAGQTLAFYITTTSEDRFDYSNGTAVGTTISSDAYLTIKEGVGQEYPIGNLYTPRVFNGRVIYSRGISSLTWNTGQSGTQIALSPSQSTVVAATVEYAAGDSYTVGGFVNVTEVDVTASASPEIICAPASSELTASTNLNKGLEGTYFSPNFQNGIMFDLSASVPLTVTGFDLFPEGPSNANYQIYYKTGTHVGFEANAGAWTSLGTSTGNAPGIGVPSGIPISLNMVAGQTLAFYITRTDGGNIYYGNGTAVGTLLNDDGNLFIYEGTGLVFPFSTTFTPRTPNTIVHYTINNPAATYSWTSGGSTAVETVTPANTANYTVSSTASGCTGMATVTVTVNDCSGTEDWNLEMPVSVYPNPSSDFVQISIGNLNGETISLNLVDMNGKSIWNSRSEMNMSEYNTLLDVSQFAQGVYYLNISSGLYAKTFKLLVSK